MTEKAKRLESLDILRGLDLFILTVFGPLLFAFAQTGDHTWLAPVLTQFTHTPWEGFRVWDMIMPLFLFMSGTTIPFSLAKYKLASEGRKQVAWRIGKRVLLLWIFGMMFQGNLLDFDPATLKLFSNTLQSIAVGYLFAAIFFLTTRPRTQIIIAALLLLAYWALMMFVKVPGYGGGDFTPDGNLCEYVDRAVFGHWRDRASVDAAGNVVFSEEYRYTWILSSLCFIVTVMTGAFAGMILKSAWSEKKKMLTMLIAGVAMIAAGWLWGLQMPVIKKIWTSSMTLVTSGYSFLLLLIFYYFVDYKGHNKGLSWLKIWGMNSILAYMLQMISFSSVGQSLFHGLEKYVGAGYYGFILTAVNLAIYFLILRFLYKRKIYLRV